ncbi:hydroxypyruvate isomerase family protein [Segetibacter aerophilus]|uniref:Hydroxypyruvate isomerase n=1 Tax=Segetibacter aerophilus TaxID=670293 RepID=A0A512BEB9_9BACT|nr:TIM barrel protein [Segetibacter aerophilus]GEO10301.1 hydroxypyruvate isomerase [Segetibacter aerophilus]
MKKQLSRRTALKNLTGSAAFFSAAMVLPSAAKAELIKEEWTDLKLKGNVNHSVCKWCYPKVSLDDLCKAAKDMGLSSIELQGPEEWPTIKKYGLTCAMPWGAGKGIENGWNNPALHDELLASFEDVIPKAAAAGLDKIITFSGNRKGLSDEQGLENCAKGLKRLMKTAEKYKVTVTMELLNSKVNHKDYQADHTKWGVELAKMIGSDRFKLLYDIYHMQIMEGDVIATIKQYHPYISHYHTGGVPGRAEIDETQELYYPAIVKAILDTGYKGHIAQEFVPKRPDALDSLRQSVKICDI